MLITGSFPPMKCGVGDYSYELAKAIAADPEINVGVLTSVFGMREGYACGIEVFPIMNRWGFSEVMRAIKIIWHWSPDIVHIQYPTQGYGNGILPWLLPLFSFLMRKKVVQTWHEGYSRRNAPKLFLKAIIPGGLVVVRPQFKENLHPALRWAFLNKKFVFIRNASAIPRANLNNEETLELRKYYLKNQKRLIVFFGFVHKNKGVELLFEISSPTTDKIVIAGEIPENESCHSEIVKRSSDKQWQEKVTVTGFLPSSEVAALLAIADAVILPFRVGGGEWNTSIHSAVLQGSFVITTSLTKSGYDEKLNVYYAKVDDVQEMKLALNTYAGKRRMHDIDIDIDKDEWRQIAKDHISFYENILH